jgi:hypothetical protein
MKLSQLHSPVFLRAYFPKNHFNNILTSRCVMWSHTNRLPQKYCHGLGVCDYRRGMNWILDLLTTNTHHSELQIITEPPLISTFYKSLQHTLSLFQPVVFSRAVPWQELLTLEFLQLPVLRSSCHSRPCRTLINSLNPNWQLLSPEISIQFCPATANHLVVISSQLST